MSTDSVSEGSEDRGTVPIRILEHTILKFTDTALPHDLTRLRQHKENILSYHQQKNWEKLNTEQVNASRTVQVLHHVGGGEGLEPLPNHTHFRLEAWELEGLINYLTHTVFCVKLTTSPTH